MAKIKNKRERTFRNFEAYKKTMGIQSEVFFLKDDAFWDYVRIHRRLGKNNIYLKEIFFESLPYPRYFSYHPLVEAISSKLNLRKEMLDEWFSDFLVSGLVRRVSQTVFKRMSRFLIPN